MFSAISLVAVIATNQTESTGKLLGVAILVDFSFA